MSFESDGKRKVIADCVSDINCALLSLEAAAELMARGTAIAQDVFALGRAAGYIGAARAMVEVAQSTMIRVIDYQSPPEPTGAAHN